MSSLGDILEDLGLYTSKKTYKVCCTVLYFTVPSVYREYIPLAEASDASATTALVCRLALPYVVDTGAPDIVFLVVHLAFHKQSVFCAPTCILDLTLSTNLREYFLFCQQALAHRTDTVSAPTVLYLRFGLFLELALL